MIRHGLLFTIPVAWSCTIAPAPWTAVVGTAPLQVLPVNGFFEAAGHCIPAA